MMETEFVPYKQSLELKALGFNEPCFGYYDGNHNLQFMYNGKPEKFTERRMGPAESVWVGWISAPLYQQAFRWFRENYDLSGLIEIGTHEFSYQIFKNGNRQLGLEPIKYNGNYEEAEFECLKKLIEIVKTK